MKRIDFDENKINRVGTEHNCVLNLGNLKFETISVPSADHLVYGERTTDMLFTKSFSYLVKLHKTNENTTHIILNIYVEFTKIGALMKPHILKMVSKMWNDKLEKLHQLSKNKSQT